MGKPFGCAATGQFPFFPDHRLSQYPLANFAILIIF
jgi:hypothetical protein